MDSTASTKWAFDEGVTAQFDNMLERSIPQYAVMRDAVFSVGASFVQPQTSILDLGCSRGAGLQPFVDKFGAHNRYRAIDVSQPMLDACRERYKNWHGIVLVDHCDLRDDFPPEHPSLTLSVLTLQFTPIEYRQSIVSRIYQNTVLGGAFIMVEKVLGETAPLDNLFVSTYLKMKSSNGYSQEEINRKKMALEGVLVPLTAKWNEELLRRCGFSQVDCFWRWMNFAGWVAVKQ